MDFNIEEAKHLFIKEELDEHGSELMQILSDELEDRELVDTQKLIESLSYQVVKHGNDWTLRLNFLSYGRVIEIVNHKNKKNPKVESNELIKKLYGIRSGDDVAKARNKRKKRKLDWYSRNVYGSLNGLYSRLSYGFSEEEIKRLKNIIEKESYQKIGSSYFGKTYKF